MAECNGSSNVPSSGEHLQVSGGGGVPSGHVQVSGGGGGVPLQVGIGDESRQKKKRQYHPQLNKPLRLTTSQWTKEETWILVNTWREDEIAHVMSTESTCRKSVALNEIATRLAHYNFLRTTEQVRLRMRWLKKEYNRIRNKVNSGIHGDISGNGAGGEGGESGEGNCGVDGSLCEEDKEKFPYFEAMDSLMSRDNSLEAHPVGVYAIQSMQEDDDEISADGGSDIRPSSYIASIKLENQSVLDEDVTCPTPEPVERAPPYRQRNRRKRDATAALIDAMNSNTQELLARLDERRADAKRRDDAFLQLFSQFVAQTAPNNTQHQQNQQQQQQQQRFPAQASPPSSSLWSQQKNRQRDDDDSAPR